MRTTLALQAVIIIVAMALFGMFISTQSTKADTVLATQPVAYQSSSPSQSGSGANQGWSCTAPTASNASVEGGRGADSEWMAPVAHQQGWIMQSGATHHSAAPSPVGGRGTGEGSDGGSAVERMVSHTSTTYSYVNSNNAFGSNNGSNNTATTNNTQGSYNSVENGDIQSNNGALNNASNEGKGSVSDSGNIKDSGNTTTTTKDSNNTKNDATVNNTNTTQNSGNTTDNSQDNSNSGNTVNETTGSNNKSEETNRV